MEKTQKASIRGWGRGGRQEFQGRKLHSLFSLCLQHRICLTEGCLALLRSHPLTRSLVCQQEDQVSLKVIDSIILFSRRRCFPLMRFYCASTSPIPCEGDLQVNQENRRAKTHFFYENPEIMVQSYSSKANNLWKEIECYLTSTLQIGELFHCIKTCDFCKN